MEGSVFFPRNDYIYILTWREKKVYRYNSVSLFLYDVLTWPKEGWGITHNNSHLILSDGSDTLFITDENLNILQEIKVRDHFGNSVSKLNELEWVKGSLVLANVY